MKSNLIAIVYLFLLLTLSCEVEPDPVPAPIANFSRTPNVIVADQTNVQFQNNSIGDITSYNWSFEQGETFSSSENPSYQFEYEGAREVSLTVQGAGGQDTKVSTYVVHAMNPNCLNVVSADIHGTSVIENFRSNGLVKNGGIRFNNIYSDEVAIVLFSPSSWLAGDYSGDHTYTISDLGNIILTPPTGVQFSNEWGIRIQGTNGLISCARNVGKVARNFSDDFYTVHAEDVLNGK